MLKLNAVGLFVNDMEKTVRFYRDVMGMRTDKKYSYPNGLNGTVELAFDVADFAQVDAEYERVTKAGGNSCISTY